jgi:hypothetical protein
MIVKAMLMNSSLLLRSGALRLTRVTIMPMENSAITPTAISTKWRWPFKGSLLDQLEPSGRCAKSTMAIMHVATNAQQVSGM